VAPGYHRLRRGVRVRADSSRNFRTVTSLIHRTLLPLLATTLLLAGCSLSDDPAPTTTESTPAVPEPSATTPAPDPTPTPTPSEEPSKLPEGSGDGEEDDKPATAGGGICSDLEAEDVGEVLGGTVRGAGLPPGGCEFSQRDGAAPSATFVETSYKNTAGGMAGAKNNATAAVEGEPQDLTGIGTAAFVVTGTMFGGEDIQGAGAVRVGDRLIQVTLGQGSGLSSAKVKALAVNLLKLAAHEAS